MLESGDVAKENLENHTVSFDAAVGKTPVTSVSLLIGQSKSLGPCNLKGWGRECSVTTTSVQFSHSVPQLCPTLRTHELQHARPPNSRSSPKLTCIKSVMPSSHLILCCPLLLSPIPPSIRVFSNESTLRMRWPKYWSFSFSISPSNEHPGLISFRMDWLDLLAVQGTFKSLLQQHSSKASILQHSAFFTVQLSHPIHDHWKNHSLD